MKCNRNAIGQWEKFRVVALGNNQVALKGGQRGHRHYCADEYNRINCNRNAIGQWERFTVIRLPHGRWALRGGKNHKLCADEFNNGVKCNRNGLGQWEKFQVHVISAGGEEEEVELGEALEEVQLGESLGKMAKTAQAVKKAVSTASVAKPTMSSPTNAYKVAVQNLAEAEEEIDDGESGTSQDLGESDEAPKAKKLYKFRRRTHYPQHPGSKNKVVVPWNVGSRRRFQQLRRRRHYVKPGTPAPTPGYQPMNSHCRGPFTAGGYALGGHDLGSVYESKPVLVARTLKPTPSPTYRGQTRAPSKKPTRRPTGPPGMLVYVGCFKDLAKRNLKLRPPPSKPQRGYTPKSCQDACPKGSKFFGLQNGGECFCDRTWSAVKTPPNALNCKGTFGKCSVEGQLCLQGTPGATSGHRCCYNKKWTKVKSPKCNVENASPYTKVKDIECNKKGDGLGGPMRNAIYEFKQGNFTAAPTPKPTARKINHLIPGSTIALLSKATNKYCGAETSMTCNRGWVRDNEKFVVYNENAPANAMQKGYKHKKGGKASIIALRGGKANRFCADEPRTYKCANEGQTCKCRGIVTYGHGSKTAKRSSSGSIGCNNGVFGDPIRGRVKSCTCNSANPVQCNRSQVAGWEKFEVVDVGSGYVALKGGRGHMYCTANAGDLRCDHPVNKPLSDKQKFKVKCVADGIEKCPQETKRL